MIFRNFSTGITFRHISTSRIEGMAMAILSFFLDDCQFFFLLCNFFEIFYYLYVKILDSLYFYYYLCRKFEKQYGFVLLSERNKSHKWKYRFWGTLPRSRNLQYRSDNWYCGFRLFLSTSMLLCGAG